MVRYEGVWTCAQCSDGVEISGSVHNCPKCGDPHNSFKDPSEEWYLPDNPREITDLDELARGEVGPNWNCGNCGQSNPGDQGQCTECKQWRSTDDHISPVTTYEDDDAENATIITDEAAPADSDFDQIGDDLTGEEDSAPLASFQAQRPSDAPVADDAYQAFRPTWRELLETNRKRIGIGVASVLAAVGLTAGGVTVYNDHIATYPVDVTVQQLSWERSVEVEELRTLTESDWYVPSGGRLIGSRSEIRSYREVFSHYETRSRQVSERKRTGSHSERYACGSKTVNRGNGQFDVETTYCNRSVDDYSIVYSEEKYQVPVYDRVPVYDTRYTYEIDRWVTDHYDPASGTANPFWPSSTLSGKQRVGDERSEKYSVVLVDSEGRQFPREIEFSAWTKLHQGKVLKGEETRQGDLRDIYWN